ncbi:MAG: hypothetical protein H6937_06170 [Burkholderiales bacterium]|nr:hypothetical protein [Burkholderiales bacterium]MDR4517406.1 hypothetical protein [Nitrosomonas sp.]
MKFLCRLICLCAFISLPALAQEPGLPAGLTSGDEPGLPAGLDLNHSTIQPAAPPTLPFGLSDLGESTVSGSEIGRNDNRLLRSVQRKLPFNLSGFWEARGGFRVTGDPNEKQQSITETRLQLQVQKSLRNIAFNLTTDLLYDNVADNLPVQLNSGRGFVDLREANLTFSPLDFVDIKAGRQILTWGTGDLVFINDLFPKDFNSFFIGRDEVYIKAPSDAAKFSLFSQWANLDIVYTPQFDADRFIDGRRISFFSPITGDLAGRNAILRPDKPDKGEVALRLYRNLGSFETALYFYEGYWKSPGGIDPVSGTVLFPKLRVVGGSIRGPVGRGIGNIETGYYNSRDDGNGNNPFVNNSEFRALAGYEQEVAKDFTVGAQYYLEHLFDYSNYLNTLPAIFPQRDRDRHVLTTRLTLLTHNQNVTWSIFSYFSPSDMDFYLRPRINYRINDYWATELGGNIFGGRKDHTLFSQFQNNSNVYLSVRFGF